MKSKVRLISMQVPGSERGDPYTLKGYRYHYATSPSILITAGLHGDEPTAIAALWYLAERLRAKNVSATVTILPCLNVLATQHSSHLMPLENLDVNRFFPGRRDGSLAERLAFKITRILSQHDAFIDVHTAGWCIPFALLDDIFDSALDQIVRTWAHAAGIPVVREMHSSEAGLQNLERSSTAWATQHLKKPAFTLELKGFKTINSKCAQKAADWLFSYIQAFPTLQKKHEILNLPTRHEIYSENSGLFEAFVVPGDSVTKGTYLGRICSENGKLRCKVLAPTKGIVLALQPVSTVQVGSWLSTLAVTSTRMRKWRE